MSDYCYDSKESSITLLTQGNLNRWYPSPGLADNLIVYGAFRAGCGESAAGGPARRGHRAGRRDLQRRNQRVREGRAVAAGLPTF